MFVIFKPKYWLTTILVFIAAGVMIRLGIWQLDRLAQRREFNARVLEWVNADMVALGPNDLDQEFYDMEYLTVSITGEYDFEHQVSMRLRQNGTQAGVSLMTPLKVVGTNTYILVERGWIPQEDAAREDWAQYDELGMVTVVGQIRRTELEPNFGSIANPTLEPGQTLLEGWYMADVAEMERQMGLTLVPDVYIQQLPDDSMVGFPVRQAQEVEITEGSHFSYAIQWFTFATILLVGYPIYAINLESGKIKAGD